MSQGNKIFVQWVRSGIGFTRKQRAAVGGLGLRRLGQTLGVKDSPATRGLVASVPHLVKIVEAPAAPWWASKPEYTVQPAERGSQSAAVARGKEPPQASGAQNSTAPAEGTAAPQKGAVAEEQSEAAESDT